MIIEKKSIGVDGVEGHPGRVYTIQFDTRQGPPNFEGTMDALMDAVELHYTKARDYDGMEQEFGLRGELIGITRKVRKLKKVIWDGHDPIFEGAQEMLMDLVGNALLALRMQKKISDKYRARWRDNHVNRPDFPRGQPMALRRPGPVEEVDAFDD